MKQKTVNIGIDVGKDRLDVYLFERDISIAVENNPQGICQLLGRLVRFRVDRIVVEATGRYERPLVEAAINRGLPILVVNPLNV